jgi:hypothetical protein
VAARPSTQRPFSRGRTMGERKGEGRQGSQLLRLLGSLGAAQPYGSEVEEGLAHRVWVARWRSRCLAPFFCGEPWRKGHSVRQSNAKRLLAAKVSLGHARHQMVERRILVDVVGEVKWPIFRVGSPEAAPHKHFCLVSIAHPQPPFRKASEKRCCYYVTKGILYLRWDLRKVVRDVPARFRALHLHTWRSTGVSWKDQN